MKNKNGYAVDIQDGFGSDVIELGMFDTDTDAITFAMKVYHRLTTHDTDLTLSLKVLKAIDYMDDTYGEDDVAIMITDNDTNTPIEW